MGVRDWGVELLHPSTYIRMELLIYVSFWGMPKTLSTTEFFKILFTVILLVIHAHFEVRTLLA